MIFKILGCGTSTGVPMPGCRCRICTSGKARNERTRTSALIALDSGKNILIDASPDLRSQSLKNDIRSVDSVLFTHSHADHIFGIEDLRSFNFINGRPIDCYGTENTFKEIKRFFNYIINPDPNYEGGELPKLTLKEIPDYGTFDVLGVKIESFLLMHGKMPVTGFKIGNLAYATDCKVIPEKSKNIIRGIKYLILDGLRHEQHKTHMTIPEAVKAADELKAEKTFLIHMTHTVDYDEENARLPENVRLCYDGLELEIC